MASENQSMTFLIIDAEKNPNSRKLADDRNSPTFASFRNGKLVNQIQTNKIDLFNTFAHETSIN
jgi:hypothetical protein